MINSKIRLKKSGRLIKDERKTANTIYYPATNHQIELL